MLFPAFVLKLFLSLIDQSKSAATNPNRALIEPDLTLSGPIPKGDNVAIQIGQVCRLECRLLLAQCVAVPDVPNRGGASFVVDPASVERELLATQMGLYVKVPFLISQVTIEGYRIFKLSANCFQLEIGSCYMSG